MAKEVKITKLGLIVYSIMISILFVGISSEYLYPESWFGEQMKSNLNKVLYAFVIIVIFYPIEKILKANGIKITEESEL